jgi:hypothetical protein
VPQCSPCRTMKVTLPAVSKEEVSLVGRGLVQEHECALGQSASTQQNCLDSVKVYRGQRLLIAAL